MAEPSATRRTTLASLAAVGGLGMLSADTATAAESGSTDTLYLPVLRDHVEGEWSKYSKNKFRPHQYRYEGSGKLRLPTEELRAVAEHTTFYVSLHGTAKFYRGQPAAEGEFMLADASGGSVIEGTTVHVEPRGTEGRLTDQYKYIDFEGPKGTYDSLNDVVVEQDATKGVFTEGVITLWREVQPENL